jgi:hypothetical protein
MRSRSPRMRGEGHQEGSALLEVMVAVALLGTLLGALATEAQRGVDAAVRLREKGAALSAVTADDPDLDAWDWGARVAGVSWAAGRVLHVYGVVEPGVQCTVGVWCAARVGVCNLGGSHGRGVGRASACGWRELGAAVADGGARRIWSQHSRARALQSGSVGDTDLRNGSDGGPSSLPEHILAKGLVVGVTRYRERVGRGAGALGI